MSELAFRNPKERRDRLPLVVQALEGGTQGVLRKQWRRGVGATDCAPGAARGSPPCLAELYLRKQATSLFRFVRCPCGAKVPKKLSDREHVCTKCGLITTRDRASATGILRLGLSLHMLTKSEVGTCVV